MEKQARNCDTPNPLIRDGSSQFGRYLAALHPDYARVDERSLADLLCYSQRFARELQYYDSTNLANGDWSSFVAEDLTAILAAISKRNFESERHCFARLAGLLNNDTTGKDRLKRTLKAVFDFTYTLAVEIDGWYRQSVEGLKLRAEMDRVILAELRESLRLTIGYYLYAEQENLLGVPTISILEDCPPLLDISGFTEPKLELIWITNESSSWAEYLDSFSQTGALEEYASAFGDPADVVKSRILGASIRILTLAETFLDIAGQLVQGSRVYMTESLEWPHHQPHMALLLTFFQLFETTQSHLNGMTAIHLDFYYKDVLRLQKRPEEPDKAHVVFELTKRAKPHLLKAGTLLKADKDATDVDVVYQLDRDIVVNEAMVSSLKAVTIDSHRIFASPVANSKDGLGEAFDAAEPSWPAFGQTGDDNVAELGIAIASPLLLLAEGQRTIDITFNLTTTPSTTTIYRQQFSCFLTGEKEWLSAKLLIAEISGSTVTFTIRLLPGAEAVTAYDAEVHGDSISVGTPVLKIIMNQVTTKGTPYNDLRDLLVESIDLRVKVNGVRDLKIQSDFGLLDASKPFQPLGPSPVHGGSFYVGSEEVFAKDLDQLRIGFRWLDPPNNFSTHYGGYPNRPSNRSFKWDLHILDDAAWVSLATKGLFHNSDAAIPAFILLLSMETQSLSIGHKPFDSELTNYGPTTKRGFLRFQLSNPDKAFYNSEYAKLYAQKVIALANYVDNGKNQPPALPNEPYTPVINSLSLDYISSRTIAVSESDTLEVRQDKFFHLHPFGVKEVHESLQPLQFLLPQFSFAEKGTTVDTEGELYIGISGLEPRQNLSLLLQVAEGSSNPKLQSQPVGWCYLSGKDWVPFEDPEILFDSTNGLISSGIITFAIPKVANSDNFLLGDELHWLRVSVSGNRGAIPNLIDVRAQAAQVSFLNQGNDSDFLLTPLPAETISGLKVKQGAIKGVEQPFSSFGGRVREQEEQFYPRVSERLRHKGRGVSVHDYEKLVLEQFPRIHKVKCINHSTYNYEDETVTVDTSEFAPGFVAVILVPDLRNKNAVDPLQPRVDLATQEEVKSYLSGLISPFAAQRLKVLNPLYETITVELEVVFHSGFDWGYYQSQLNLDLTGYLSPWAYEDGSDISFEGRIHQSSILNFVEEQGYVDFVTDIQMTHTSDANGPSVVEEATPATARSILVSATDHTITEATR